MAYHPVNDMTDRLDPLPLEYWNPDLPAPAAAVPAPRSPADRTDWLTMAFVVCVAVGMAFSIVVALAWVLGA